MPERQWTTVERTEKNSCMRICDRCDAAFVGWNYSRHCPDCDDKLKAQYAGIEKSFRPIGG